MMRAARALLRPPRRAIATAPSETVTILGAGSFGSAMAFVAGTSSPDAAVRLWARGANLVMEINSRRTNAQYLPPDALPMPKNVSATHHLKEAVADSSVIVLAVPGEFLPQTLDQIDLNDKVVVSLVKSARVVEVPPLLKFMTVCEEVETRFPKARACALMGPNVHHAIARGEFAEATVGAADAAVGARVAGIFGSRDFRVDVCADRAGVELCGVLKNVVALGSGFADAVVGPNARAAVIRRGLVEMHEFAARLRPAVERETFFESAAGVGDLILTTSAGRGRVLAKAFAENTRADEAPGDTWRRLESNFFHGMKLPDMHTARDVGSLLDGRGWRADFPLLAAVDDVAWHGAEATAVIDALR